MDEHTGGNWEAAYAEISEELARTKKRLAEARKEVFARADAALRLSSMKTVRLAKKLSGKEALSDALQNLRPERAGEEIGIFSVLDYEGCSGDDLALRGWAYDLQGVVPRILLRDRNGILPAEISFFPRPDVNEKFGIAEETRTGFSLRLPLTAVKEEHLRLELENELGYVAREILVPKGEAKRQAYRESHRGPIYAEDAGGYHDWFLQQRVTEEELRAQRAKRFRCAPLISICIPIYNTQAAYLSQLMNSLLAQSYEKIELCLADGSSEQGPGAFLQELGKRDARVRYLRLAENRGIAENTNAAISMATGEFIMLVDHDDLLEKDACYEIVRALNEVPETDALYADEDKLLFDYGLFCDPIFKPDYNPDLLRSNNYITHPFCVRKSLADRVAEEGGGFERPAYDGAQDYDFILRCCEKARTITHVSKVLYHWRMHETSTSLNPESKGYAFENGRKALEEHFRRCKLSAEAELTEDFGCYRAVWKVTGTPLLSVLLSGRGQLEDWRKTIQSLSKSGGNRIEFLLLSKEAACLQEEFENIRMVSARSVREEKEAGLWNAAAREAKGAYLLFVDQPVTLTTARGMRDMIGICQREDVAACGPALYDSENRLISCGIVLDRNTIATHICAGEERGSTYYYGRIKKTQDVSALSRTCFLVQKKVFEACGALDEGFSLPYSVIDLCLRMRTRGYLIVYCAETSFTLQASGMTVAASKEEQDSKEEEKARLLERHAEYYKKGDPCFNPNLDSGSIRYVLAGTMPEN